MRIPRIYTPQPLSQGAELELEEQASRHLLKVLRLETGAELILFNGRGGEYRGRISEAGKKCARVRVAEFSATDRDSPLHTHLYIGISRGDRFDFVLQKATELGVTEITPLFTERCEVKLKGERLEKKLLQWRHLTLSACEQCQRNIPPLLHSAQHYSQALQACGEELRLVLHHRAASALSDLASSPSSVALLIGPEGGLSEPEIDLAQRQGFVSTLIGPRVLRTETAPLVALSLLQARWGDY